MNLCCEMQDSGKLIQAKNTTAVSQIYHKYTTNNTTYHKSTYIEQHAAIR